MSRNNLIPFVTLLLFAFVTACGGQKPLPIAAAIQNAERLDGKAVRVRGVANVWVDPSQAEMCRFGGCTIAPDGTLLKQGHVSGWLTLYDSIDPEKEDLWAYGGPRDAIGVEISESSFKCEGDSCKLTCSPFEVASLQTYEFVGTLRVNGDSEYVLENIDLEQSKQLENGSPFKRGLSTFSFHEGPS